MSVVTVDDMVPVGRSSPSDVKQERRGRRRYVRVRLPMDAEVENERHRITDISVNGFAVDASLPGRRIGEVMNCVLMVPMHGFTASISLTATLVRRDEFRRRSGFEIVDADGGVVETLGGLIRSRLAGRIPATGELAAWSERNTAETPPGPESNDRATARTIKSAFFIFLRVGGFAVAGVAVIVAAAFVGYDRLFVVRTSIAAFTAPKIELRAPGKGLLQESILVPGQRVDRDELLGRIMDRELDSELAIARLLLGQRRLMLENLRQAPAQPSRAIPSALGEVMFSEIGAAVEKRILEMRTIIGMLRVRIRAMELRIVQNSIHSPCDCAVHWLRSTTGGEWIQEGDRLFVLVSSAPEDVLVEARVSLDGIERIEIDQKAVVHVPNQAENIHARVTAIRLEGAQQPRAGFPDWARRDSSRGTVLLTPDTSVGAHLIGIPVDVRIPVLSIEDIWPWLKVRLATIAGAGTGDFHARSHDPSRGPGDRSRIRAGSNGHNAPPAAILRTH